ncbi:hypothetical protein PHAVU_002G126600, partial [Phaseolus vulgaris]
DLQHNLKHQRVSELNLQGYIGNLSYMRSINFYGEIPPKLGRLSQLHNLSVGNNSLVGEITTNLTGCTNLKFLHLGGNNFIHKIPIEIGSLRKLQHLILSNNEFTGGIPSFMGNLSSLTLLSVEGNNLEGSIPHEICSLKSLTWIAFHLNKLRGTFPTCLYNISSLNIISATNNQLNGSLPTNIFHTLPNLHKLLISNNQIIGQVPSLSKLQDLRYLSFSGNNLGDNSTDDLDILKSLTNCRQLQMIDIGFNNFGGHLPNSWGNLSMQLNELYQGGNHIVGEIPSAIGNLIGLVLLSMTGNSIDGTIPTTFGKLQNMQKLRLGRNKLSGGIGAFIGNLRNCQRLQHLVLSRNNLTGTIPVELFSISSLTTSLDLSQNLLNGSIPVEVGNLKNLGYLDMSENNLSWNSLNGIIPPSLASLKGLRSLDLSQNSLGGSIPNDLQKISVLQYFNVSLNMLVGEVPQGGVFQNASALVVTGNKNLCGGISELHLPPCPVDGKKLAKLHPFMLIATIVSAVAFLLIIASQKRVVAIKVLNLQKRGSQKSFIAECNALKNIKHRNVVPILTCCSGIDYKCQEFKALIFYNVLLDDDMIAQVSDFGLVRLFSTINGTSSQLTSTIVIKGTLGYYGMGSEVSTDGDMYSFGILLLEMLKGRRPIDEIFEDGQHLHTFVESSLPDNLLQVLDPSIVLNQEEEQNSQNLTPTVEKCIVSLFKIGLVCSMESPKERMKVDVTREVSEIRKTFLAM